MEEDSWKLAPGFLWLCHRRLSPCWFSCIFFQCNKSSLWVWLHAESCESSSWITKVWRLRHTLLSDTGSYRWFSKALTSLMLWHTLQVNSWQNSHRNLELASSVFSRQNNYELSKRKPRIWKFNFLFLNLCKYKLLTCDSAHSPWEKYWFPCQVLTKFRRGSIRIHVSLHIVWPTLGSKHKMGVEREYKNWTPSSSGSLANSRTKLSETLKF